MAKLIVAMDFPDVKKALSMASLMEGSIKWLKVGLELFILGGPALVCALKKMGYNIFLDLKFYDIPHTVECAVKAAVSIEADMLTLHCMGGEKMCRAASEALSNLKTRPLLFGVTVLTSFAAGEMPGIDETPQSFAEKLALNALCWGLDGVVCSGKEAGEIKKICPHLLTLCPGIRPGGACSDDQARIVTPGQAVAAGADFLVVGRPIIASPDPLKIVSEILCEMDNV